MFPIVPLDVLLALEQAFPELSPMHHETHFDMTWRGGQSSVVRLLRRKFNEQEANILNPEESQDVPATS